MTNEAIIRGDIFIARTPQPEAPDNLLFGTRPVVCISHLDAWSKLVTVVPLQRNENDRKVGPCDLLLDADRLNRLDDPGSIVRTGQLRTVPADWLLHRMGRVSDTDMCRIEQCIADYLDFGL